MPEDRDRLAGYGCATVVPGSAPIPRTAGRQGAEPQQASSVVCVCSVRQPCVPSPVLAELRDAHRVRELPPAAPRSHAGHSKDSVPPASAGGIRKASGSVIGEILSRPPRLTIASVQIASNSEPVQSFSDAGAFGLAGWSAPQVSVSDWARRRSRSTRSALATLAQLRRPPPRTRSLLFMVEVAAT
jgi:hypothetical protein